MTDRLRGSNCVALPVTHHSAEVRQAASGAAFVSLKLETRAAVETACAAYRLNRQSQTLRCWASREDGPLRPFRVHGRLMWPTARLRELCGVA